MSGGPPRDDAPGRDPARAGAPYRLHAYHLLMAVPAIGMLVGVPFANHVRTQVLGLPFLLFWILAWVLVTSAVTGIVYRIDRDRQAEDQLSSESTPR